MSATYSHRARPCGEEFLPKKGGEGRDQKYNLCDLGRSSFECFEDVKEF